MGWWGAIIGGALGYVLGGPLGALLGAMLGYSLSSGRVRVGWSGYDAAQVQTAFFTATFSVMGHIAKADGRVSEDEIRAARAVMAHMNLDAERQQAAIARFEQGKQPGFSLDAALLQLRAACHGRADLLRMFLQIQLHAAYADGVMHPAERQIIERICALFGISTLELAQYEAFIRAQQTFRGGETPAQARVDKLAAAYQTLGVKPETGNEDIKRAYRRLMKDNHPDKLVARGLPEQMIRLAQEKVQQINVAYETIQAARGMK